MNEPCSVLPAERIERAIFVIRGQKVMLNTELAELYGVEPKVLVQAVKRNRERFPEGFYVSAYKSRVCQLEVTNCDFKLGWYCRSV